MIREQKRRATARLLGEVVDEDGIPVCEGVGIDGGGLGLLGIGSENVTLPTHARDDLQLAVRL